ncbi:hypothetical protein BSPLISOX_722, partial [uncultured Gammaproteobacteria bacterium]
MPNPFVISILILITTLATTPTIANTNLNTPNKTTTAPNSTTTKALAPNLNTTNQLNTQAKAIDIQAGYNGSLNESYNKTSSFSLAGLVGIGSLYTSTEDLEGRIKKTAVNSTLSGNNITLNANNNINAAGVDIQADNSISGTAKDINIQNVNNTDTHYSKHKKVKVSLADVLGTIAKNPLLLKKESDGKVSLTLATATIDKAAERSTKTTVQLSNIDAGAGGISLTANDKHSNDKHSNDKHADNNLTNQSDNNPANQPSNNPTNQASNNPANQSDSNPTNQPDNNPPNPPQGNINLTGVNLTATDGDINLTANNNTNIKAALETTNTKSSESHSKAEIKFVVKNEYAQIIPAIKAVKTAKQNLSKAKDAYSAYQQDLAQQQAQLQDLQAKLEADIGFIEQIDIDEMSELVGDLQADKKYYQTNIALAASSLAAKTTALAAQLATAAASSGTYGFNAGIEFDIDALERQLQAQQTQSIASNLIANNININTNKTTTIVGSNLQANANNADNAVNSDNANNANNAVNTNNANNA